MKMILHRLLSPRVFLEQAAPFTLAALALSSAPLFATPAPAAELSVADARRELDYARGLASTYSLVGLAAEVLERAESAGFPASLVEELRLAKCDVFAIGALAERDPAKRHEVFEQALAAYRDFISKNQRSASLPEAEAAFVDTADKYAQSLAASLETAVGEEAEKMRQKRVEVLTEAVAKTSELIEGLKSIPDRTEKQKLQLYELLLKRGKMLTATALSQENPTFSFEQAYATLEELVYTAGENTPYGLLAFIALGDNQLARGKAVDAAYSYEYVVNTAIPRDTAEWDRQVQERELTQADKQTSWAFVELATPGLINAWMEAGKPDQALAWALHAYNTQKREGFALNVPAGTLALLEVARALLENGGYVGGSLAAGEAQWFPTEDDMKAKFSNRRDRTTAIDLALSIAQQVNRENKGNILQIRAQKLIKRIIDRPGVTASLETLIEAAKGEYNDRNYDAAIAGFRQVLAALGREDEATRKRTGGEILNLMGKAYGRSDRPLLAAAAFQEGLDRFQGDEVYDSENAKNWLAAAQLTQRALDPKKSDAGLGDLVRQAEQAVLRYGDASDGDSIIWRDAQKLADEGKWSEAKAKYAQISTGSEYYEKAIVASSFADYKAGDVDRAVAGFTDYLENFVTDPKNTIVDSQRRRARRQEAMALAAYFRGEAAYSKALKSKKPEDWNKVAELLEGYERRYEGQSNFSAAAMRMAAEARLALDEFDKARAIYDRMSADAEIAKKRDTASLAISIHDVFKKRRDDAEKAGDRATYEDLTRRMAELLTAVNSGEGAPSFPNLRNESKYWMELGNYVEAERVLRKIVANFQKSNPADIENFIAPDLGHALLEQKKVADAYATLSPLAAGAKKPSKQTVIDYARSVFGWIEEDPEGGTDYVRIPGATQDPKVIEDAFGKLLAISGGETSWTAAWYPLNFDVLYAYWVWGQVDSKQMEAAKNAMKRFTTDSLDQQYSGIDRELEKAGGELNRKYGDGVLRKRYIWLRRQLGG